MRSRYTAFVRGEIDYILATTAPETEMDRSETERWSRNSEWLGLRILETNDGGPDDDEGTVEFIARFRLADKERSHHELASFRRENGRWVFVDGVNPRPTLRRTEPKIGRNDPCPCGSGKKYKKCCGAK